MGKRGWTTLKMMSGDEVFWQGKVRNEHVADLRETLWMAAIQNGGSDCGAIEAIAQECLSTWLPAHEHNLSHRQLEDRDVLRRAGWRCEICRRVRPLQVHHRVFRSHGGDDSVANKVAVCPRCHEIEHGR